MARMCLRTSAVSNRLPTLAFVPFSTWTSNNNKRWRYNSKLPSPQSNQQQQQQKQPPSNLRNKPPEEKRPPRLYSRTKLRGSKKRSLLEQTGLYRADRVLGNRTGDPRNECTKLLQSKRVFQKKPEDGSWFAVPGPASKIPMNAELFIDKTHVVPPPAPLLAIYHKPKWVLSVRHDPRGRPCVDQVFAPKKNKSKLQMHPVGRLDYDSSGLLLFSSSGALTQLLLHPKHEITKEYVAVVIGTVNMEQLQDRFRKGVNTGEGMKTGEVLSVITPFPNTDESTGPFATVAQYLQHVKQTLPSEYTNNKDWKSHDYHESEEIWKAESLSQVTVRVSEGKHRMVRRMLKNCGHAVVDLKRIQFGNIALGDLAVGSTRYLRESELKWAKKLLLEYLKSKQQKDEDFLFNEEDFKEKTDEKKSDGGNEKHHFDDRDFNYDIEDVDFAVEQ